MNENLFNRTHQTFSLILLLTSAFLILDFFIPKDQISCQLDNVVTYSSSSRSRMGGTSFKEITLNKGSFVTFKSSVPSLSFSGNLKLRTSYFLDLVKSLKSNDGIIVPNYNIYVMLLFVGLFSSFIGCFKNISMNTRFNLILVWLFTLPFNAFLFYFILLN